MEITIDKSNYKPIEEKLRKKYRVHLRYKPDDLFLNSNGYSFMDYYILKADYNRCPSLLGNVIKNSTPHMHSVREARYIHHGRGMFLLYNNYQADNPTILVIPKGFFISIPECMLHSFIHIDTPLVVARYKTSEDE